MVKVSIVKRNFFFFLSYVEFKILVEKIVEKMFNLESLGLIIFNEIKFLVFKYSVFYYVKEG